jgi:hypothetical protein
VLQLKDPIWVIERGSGTRGDDRPDGGEFLHDFILGFAQKWCNLTLSERQANPSRFTFSASDGNAMKGSHIC